MKDASFSLSRMLFSHHRGIKKTIWLLTSLRCLMGCQSSRVEKMATKQKTKNKQCRMMALDVSSFLETMVSDYLVFVSSSFFLSLGNNYSYAPFSPPISRF
jgi:hypothetical protein